MTIQEPCFWFINEDKPETEQSMQACCVNCQQLSNIKGWYWPGDQIGYGDYNLNCSFCNKIINEYKENNE